MRQLGSITDSMDMNLSKLWERVKKRGAYCTAVHGVTKNWTRLHLDNNECYHQRLQGESGGIIYVNLLYELEDVI